MKIYLLRYNVFSVDDYFTLLIGVFDSKDRLNEVIENYDKNNWFDREDAIQEEYELEDKDSTEGVYIIYFKPKKESIIRVIEVLGDENEILNKLSCLKKDISLNLVDAEIFTEYYPINIPFWDGGFYLL